MAVSAEGSTVAAYRHENIAYITVHFASGFLGHFHVNWLAPVKIRRMLLGGSQRLLVFDDMDPSEKVLSMTRAWTSTARTAPPAEQILVSYRTGDMYRPQTGQARGAGGGRPRVCRRHHRAAPAATGATTGIHVVSLLEAAEQSLRLEGRRVRL